MKKLSKLILGITGLVSLLPSYLILTESKLLPPTDDFKSLLLVVAQFTAFMVVVLTLINRVMLSKLSIKKINLIIIGIATLFLISLFCYFHYLNRLVLEDDYGAVVLPLYQTPKLSEKIELYGSIFNFFHETDSITVYEYFNKHKDIKGAVFYSYIVLYFFLILNICLLVFSSILASIKLKATRIRLT
ncbi:hypothetical protein [Aquimarina macrocephali]|uniref:hypothetical protein n=1 Tax=Aquimarina macrocephali TaxID=666563 RepID=UPI003F6679B9